MKILVTWVGHTDLRAFAAQSEEAVRQDIKAAVGRLEPVPEGLGPVHSLLKKHAFDKVRILSNYPRQVTQLFLNWLPVQTEGRQVPVKNPTDYAEVFQAADAELQALKQECAGTDCELFIHLSPGTPAMAAVWVLLGKTRYPATFYQSFKDKVWETEIPFDLRLDVVPELLHGPDRSLQHLAATPPAEVPGFERIAGNSQALRLAVGRARKAAIRDVPVLLLGESGTGKELFARAMHAASHRRNQPFVVVNCAALPQNLLESELFGHIKGAFTGAAKDYAGAFERADGGTLFLDEIGECSLDLQVKLLRVLQPPGGKPATAKTIRRIGSETEKEVDVRVLAATNRDLVEQIQVREFREDLFYRLAVITIKLPALNERKSDIAIIADVLLTQINAEFARNEPGYYDKSISESAKSFMLSQRWPGNVRQLYNCLLQAAVMSDADELTAFDLETAVADMTVPDGSSEDALNCPLGDGFSIDAHLEAIQRHFLSRAMQQAHGVKAEATRLLGMKNYQTLEAQLKRLNVTWETD